MDNMIKSTMLEIIKNGESSKIEFKTEDVHPNTLAEEIVSFVNLEGGTILIGVNDSGEVIGCSHKDIEEFIINICRNNIKPSIIPVIEKIEIDKKRVRNMLQFDETPVIKASMESIDTFKVNTYLAKLGQSSLYEDNKESLKNDLINLSILINVDNNLFPSLSGILAFGKNPQKYFPSYNIMCGAYLGNDFLSDTISEKELTGTLDELIEDSIAFLKLTMTQKITIEDNLRRKDSYIYPVEGLREAIVNALCHRDYTISGSSIRLFLFKNRLEIHSPEGLPNTLTIENMFYRQFTRNQSIASFLTGSGYMERRGKGLLRMKKICEQNGLKCEFSILSDNSEFIVTFRND
ncbi:MAG: putative DNA binding domain-containing protein [Desulfobacterales bacterium]|nr:putative DNA binding domain-containing protein [Desulfobacterales bacterium]